MTQRRWTKVNQRSAPGLPVEVLASIGSAPAEARADDRDADLPGVAVMEVQVDLPDFWREWKRAQREAKHRVPALLIRRRRSRLLMVIAAEDIPCLFAAIRAVQERPE